MTGRPWRCPCGITLGTVDRRAGTLYVTHPGVFVEHGGRVVHVHCPCGAVKPFRGQRVVLRPGVSEPRRKAS